jgi:hypothetical protein
VTAPHAGPVGRRPVLPRDDGRAAALDRLLRSATEEAARLLGADGAILYLLDPEADRLRFTHDAGVGSLGADHWLRTLELELGTNKAKDLRPVRTFRVLGLRLSLAA